MLKLLLSIVSFCIFNSFGLISGETYKQNDMGTMCTVRIDQSGNSYIYAVWTDSRINNDSLEIYSSDGVFEYISIKAYIQRQNEISNSQVYRSFKLFDAEKYLSVDNHRTKWPVYSNPAEITLDKILSKPCQTSIVYQIPFEGHFFTPALANGDWEWLQEENFVLYFETPTGSDQFCSVAAFGPKEKYSDGTIQRIKDKMIKIGDMGDIFMKYINELYFDYDIVVSGYCSC